VIVRILEDGQFDVDERTAHELETLDAGLEAALVAHDETRFRAALSELINAVHNKGRRLEPTTIVPSDLALPAADSTLEEAHTLLSSEPATEG
jgi:hypothetical protein